MNLVDVSGSGIRLDRCSSHFGFKNFTQYGLAMADAVMYSLALEFEATFWTQDVDYHDLPSVHHFPKP